MGKRLLTSEYAKIVLEGLLLPNHDLFNYYANKVEKHYLHNPEILSEFKKILNEWIEWYKKQVHGGKVPVKMEDGTTKWFDKNQTWETDNEGNITWHDLEEDKIWLLPLLSEKNVRVNKAFFEKHLKTIENIHELEKQKMKNYVIDSVHTTLSGAVKSRNLDLRAEFEVDYSQTLPEYYLDKAKELCDIFKVDFKITKSDIKRLDIHSEEVEVGDNGTMFPEWPNNPPEAFELFKKFHSRKWLLIEISGFLDIFHSWNERAMNEELAEINQFISKTSDITLDTAFKDEYRFSDQKERVYLRLDNDYYINKKNIQSDYSVAESVYGRYFLFKDLLKQKLNQHINTIRTSKLQTNLTDTQRSLLFDLLVKDNYIPDSDKDGFIWAFGGENDKYKAFKVKWLKNKQLLRELLIPLKHPEMIKADFERLIPLIFIDIKNNAITLAKNKPVLSQDSDKITEILRKIATC